MTNDDIRDVIIVGGGSTGLSAALQLARLRFQVTVLDDGAPRNRFAADMHGVLGRDHTSPLDLLADGRRELERYGVDVRAGAARGAERDGALFLVPTASGAVLRARRVLVATGVRDVLPAVEGLAERWGRGVHHCPFCDGWENRDRRIGVLAQTADSAHAVGLLHRLSDTVTVLTGGASPFSAEQLDRFAGWGVAVDDRTLSRVLPAEGGDAAADAPGIRGVELSDGEVLPLDALFVRPDAVPLDDVLVSLGAERTEALGKTWAAVDPMGRTSVRGLWAAGNVVNPMLSVAASIAAGATAGYGLCAELLEG